MGLFGGGNSSSSTTAQSAGFSSTTGANTQVQGNNNRISFIDPGALKAATDIAGMSLQAGQNIAGEALNSAADATSGANSLASQAISAVSLSAQGQTQSILLEGVKWGALVLLGYFLMKVFAKGSG
jgi:hypothetical protein